MRLACREAFADRVGTLTAIVDDRRQATGDRLRALDLLGRYGGLMQPSLAEEDAVQDSRGRGHVLTVSAEILDDESKLAAVMHALPGPPSSVVLLPAMDKGLESKPAAEMLLRGLGGPFTTAPAPDQRSRAQAPVPPKRRRVVVADGDPPIVGNPRPARPRPRPRRQLDDLREFDQGEL